MGVRVYRYDDDNFEWVLSESHYILIFEWINNVISSLFRKKSKLKNTDIYTIKRIEFSIILVKTLIGCFIFQLNTFENSFYIFINDEFADYCWK